MLVSCVFFFFKQKTAYEMRISDWSSDVCSSVLYWDTLADVAYKYWSTDLRDDMDDNVLTSAADPASWQHMVTFGVSIGLQGTLDPNNPPPSPWNVDPTTGGEGPKRIDDLWHASLNGRGTFVVASNRDKLASALIDRKSTRLNSSH